MTLGYSLRQGCHGLAPQGRGGQHVGFVHAGQAAVACRGSLEGIAGHAFDFRDAVGGDVARPSLVLLAFDLVLTEINIPGEFADDFEVAIDQALRAEGRNSSQGRTQSSRSQIDIEAELLAQTQKSRLGARAETASIPTSIRRWLREELHRPNGSRPEFRAEGASRSGRSRLRQKGVREIANLWLKAVAQSPKSWTAARMTSGPIPSPGNTAIVFRSSRHCIESEFSQACVAVCCGGARLDAAHLVNDRKQVAVSHFFFRVRHRNRHCIAVGEFRVSCLIAEFVESRTQCIPSGVLTQAQAGATARRLSRGV